MKKEFKDLGNQLYKVYGEFYALSKGCKHLKEGGKYFYCNHPYHTASSGSSKRCTLISCIVIDGIAEY